jgi:ribosomal protein L15E
MGRLKIIWGLPTATESEGKKPRIWNWRSQLIWQRLEIHTREAFPQRLGMTQNNLGIAYRNRIRGKNQNLELAIALI